MKRKTFKKALAGISAAAMLVSAMPMTLIADAYSYTNIDNSDDLFSSLALGINDDSGQSGGDLSYKTGNDFSTAGLNIDLKGFCVADYSRYQINEVYATENNNGNVSTIIESAEYNWDKAAEDIMAADSDFIQGVTFDQTGDPKSGTTNYNANFGKIKTITLNMPINKTNGKGGVTDTVYEPIEFTVVRNQDDIIASFSDNALNEARHIILADDIDLTSWTYYKSEGGSEADIPDSLKKQLSYTGDIDINLNGCTLTTKAGIQVSGKKMRIWGNGSTSAITSADGLNAARTPASTLAAYGSSAVIELYDNVKIWNKDAGNSTKAAISGEGTLIMCGDNVIVQHDGGKAIGNATGTTTGGIATFVAGDYLYNNKAATFSGKDGSTEDGDRDNFKPNGTTASTTVNVVNESKFSTMKIHNYNQYGFEVTDRTGDWSNSQNYLDVDPSTPNVMDYGYEPIRNYDSGNQKAGDTIKFDVTASDISTPNVYAENIGQLYFLAQQINDGKGLYKKVSAKLANTEFDFSKAPTPWTPINASAIDLVIDGQFTDNSITKYSVIKNLNVEVASGDAGFVAKTSTNGASSIKNLGFENATVTGASVTGKESTGVVVGYGDSVAIQNVYVNNSAVKGTIKGGNYTGAIAGTLYNSTIDHTYSAAYVQPIAIISGSTVTYLAKNGVKTNEGLTNFYDKGLVTPAAGSSSATYLVGATSKNFKEGRVAFMLNGHNPAQEVASATLKGWNNGTNSGTGSTSCSVNTYNTAPYNGTYEADVFGQTLDGTKYPTFIDVTNAGTKVASNRVFREIITTCTGVKTAWTATNANFLNEEVDSAKGGHTGTTFCSVCGAYKITEDNFDSVLLPYLRDNADTDVYVDGGVDTVKNGGDPGHDGWLSPTEIAAVESVVIDLSKAESTKTVDEIIGQIYSTTAANKLKGWDLLNAQTVNTDGTFTGTGDVTDVRFVVKDSVVCRLDTDGGNDTTEEDAIKKGFLVASGFETDKFEAVTSAASPVTGTPPTWATSIMQSRYIVDSNVDKSTVATVDETPNVTDDASKKYSYYVSADQNATGVTSGLRKNTKKAENGKVAYASASFTDGTIGYTVIFLGGVAHNELASDKDNGAYDSAKDQAAPNKPVVAVNNQNSDGTSTAGSTHTYVGYYCDCVLATEECITTNPTINFTGHKFGCTKCDFNNSSSAEVPHDFEVLFTIGNVTVKRCMGCGYVTAAKETIITASTPVLSRPEYNDASGKPSKAFRQSYSFSITAGDGEMVSYGVIYKKKPTDESAIDSAKLKGDASTGKYFAEDSNNVITLDTEELAKDGVNYTSRKGVKSNLTYRANFSLAAKSDVVEVAGYVIYKANDGTYGLKVTPLTSQSFEDVAYAEIVNSNYIEEAGHSGYFDSKGLERERFLYNFDVADDCTFVKYGVLLTTNKDTPVTNETKIEDADSSIDTANGIKIGSGSPTSDAIKSLTYAPAMVMNVNNTGTIRAFAVVEKYDLEWTIYTDVQSYTKTQALTRN